MQSDSSQISPIKAIHDLARRNKISAEYQLEKESGPAHAKIYTIRLHLGEKDYIGVDRSIKLAQRAAAQIALNDYKPLSPINNSDHDRNMPQSPTVALNTWAAQHHIPTRYILLNEQFLPPSPNFSWSHPHIIFFYRLYFGHDLYFDGHGSSHQQARINCACHALNFIQQNQLSITLSTPPSQTQSKPHISLMYERAKQLGLSVQIEYIEPLTITYHIGEEYSTTATGSTKNLAKQLAAEKMLEILPLPTEKQKQKHNRKRSNQRIKFIEQKGSTNYSLSEEINPITRLYQIARARNLNLEFVESENCSTEKLFHFQVKFNENEFADGYGKNKQAAKRSAAENLLSKLYPNLPPPPAKGLLKRDENSHKSHEKKHVHFLDENLIQQQLINSCQKLNIHIEYNDQMITDNQYQSILSLSKDDQLLAQFRGNANSIIHAQENVSVVAWKNLQDLFNHQIQTSPLVQEQ